MKIRQLVICCTLLIFASTNLFAAEAVGHAAESGLRQVEQNNFSIHILAMLLVGFGFLMVFVRNYGYSATTGTYLVRLLVRKGKLGCGDMANAALAGGVAIGATCNQAAPLTAFIIGSVAGGMCVLGYAVIQPRLQTLLKTVDTCGVHNLHGMPGLFGGVAAIFVVPGIAKPQIIGIAVTVLLALLSGIIGGYLIRATGAKQMAYED
jgi:hypothetical protein